MTDERGTTVVRPAGPTAGANAGEMTPAAAAPWQLVEQWLAEWQLDDAQRASLARVPRAEALDAAVSTGVLSADEAARWWSRRQRLPDWDGQCDIAAAAQVAARVEYEFASDHLVLLLCLGHDGQGRPVYQCLTARPWRWQALDNLRLHLAAPLELAVGPEVEVRDLIGRVYDRRMAESQAVAAATPVAAPERPDGELAHALQRLSERELLATADREPVAKLVDALLFDAASRRASDLHVHPYPDRVQVRYRLDGVLHDVHRLPRTLHDQVVGRIKVLGGMDVAEKRLAQDGRAGVQVGPRRVDLRISSLPTTVGERVVVRLLEQTAKLRDLSELGMDPVVERSFREAINRSTGLILVSGPTGSGKSTTLYSALAQLDATAKNILTLEDPVEYRLSGISQTQVSDRKGMSFLSGLRHILRQDPDVIMVGEIRDEPTARMVIQSSLTGHLVLSTLHTNSAAGAVTRLADLGIERFLIASSLIGVLAQRLVRRVCRTCGGAGCPTCCGTGYAGRMPLFEWLAVRQRIRDQILLGATAEQLQATATAEGLRTLRQQAVDAVEKGLTSEAEVARVLGGNEG